MDYAVDLIIFGISNRENNNIRELSKKELSLILVKRDKEPFNGKWVLPGGYVKKNETSEIAAKRVLEKETGLTDIDLYLSNINDGVNRDPRNRTISVSYIALIDLEKINQELKENSKWFDINYSIEENRIDIVLNNFEDTLYFSVVRSIIDNKSEYEKYSTYNNDSLGFDHDVIIAKGLMDLRYKVKNSDIIFNLMPEYFTIGALEQIYGNILKEKVVNSAFRRTIAPRIKVTNKMTKTGGHRPSSLCKYKDSNKSNFIEIVIPEMVNIYDEKTGEKTSAVISKDSAHKLGIWHGSIHLIIVNKDKTKTIFQKRCSVKELYPNMWDIAGGGHISSEESENKAVKRELNEELGLNPDKYNIKFIKQFKEELNNNGIDSKEFVSMFVIYSDIDINDIKLQKEEVSDVKWITKDEMNKLIKDKKVVPHEEEYNLLNEILI